MNIQLGAALWDDKKFTTSRVKILGFILSGIIHESDNPEKENLALVIKDFNNNFLTDEFIRTSYIEMEEKIENFLKETSVNSKSPLSCIAQDIAHIITLEGKYNHLE